MIHRNFIFRTEASKRDAVVFLMIGILGLMLYSNVLQGEFIADDYPYIIDNHALKDIFNIKAIWESFRTRFLAGMTFALNYAFGQNNVIGYHLVNVFFHMCASSAVYIFCKDLLQTPTLKTNSRKPHEYLFPVFATFIFLCHPIQTQAVAYIMQRMTSMATLCYLLTLIFYMKARRQKAARYMALACLTMFVGIFCKEMIITVPLMLMVIEIVFFNADTTQWKKRLLNMAPFFILSGILMFIFLLDAQSSVFDLKTQISRRSFNWHYFLTEINVLRTYLRLWVLPINQNHHYAYPMAQSLFEPATLYSVFLLIGLMIVAVRYLKTHPLLSFAIFWFFVAISVEFTVVCFVNRGAIYEHWMYLGTVGFAIGLSAGLSHLIRAPQIYKRVMFAFVVLLSALTFHRNFVWQNEIVFWEDVYKKSWKDPIVYLGVGTAYQRQGYDQKALEYFQKGVVRFFKTHDKLTPINRYYLSGLYNNIGIIYHHMGKDAEALKAYKRSYKADPQNTSTFRNLAKYTLDAQQYDKAIFFLKEKIRLDPTDPEDYYGLGLAYLNLGKKEEAKVFFQKTYQLEKKYGNHERARKLLRLIKRLEGISFN